MPNLSPNQNYITTIQQHRARGNRITVQANTPEYFQLHVTANWISRLPSNVSNLFGTLGELVNLSLGIGSQYTLINQWLTMQTWAGTDPLEFALEFEFNALTSADQDVWTPMNTLASMCLPGAYMGMLTSPGPNFREPNLNRVELRIGKVIYMPSVILIDVTNTWDTMLDKNGIPISGKSEVRFRTIDTYTQDDLLGATMPGGNYQRGDFISSGEQANRDRMIGILQGNGMSSSQISNFISSWLGPGAVPPSLQNQGSLYGSN